MMVEELVAQFPEVPRDLRDDPALAAFADACGPLLQVARKPSNCAVEHDAANHYYMKLISPLGIYGYGLASREQTVAVLETQTRQARADLPSFAASLLPAGVAASEVRGPGCG